MTIRTKYQRAEWPRLLSLIPAAKVKSVAKCLEERHSVCDISLPKSGLALLQLSESALCDKYFIGEVPLSCAHVKVISKDGISAKGWAQMLDDRVGLVRAIAILDAVLAGQLPGFESIYPLLEEGGEKQGEVEALRKNILLKTRVDFSLLGTIEQEGES